ncbi:MAG: SpoIIE family protein phosphatase, partial [Bacteroidia bacterium]|nr:SpoIIE family protein phosphatase [Bacteroidia bacterium]
NDGQLWLGTIAGLSVYNGIEFKTLTKRDGLAEDWVTASFKDKDGNLWFGHWGGSITIYKAKDKQLSKLTLEEILEYKGINTIYQDQGGLIWIGSNGAGICVYDPVRNNYLNIKKEQGLSSDVVFSITSDSRGRIWCGTTEGITMFDPFKITDKLKNSDTDNKVDENLLLKLKYYNVENGLPGKVVLCLLHTSKNKIIAGTAKNGIAMLDENSSDPVFRKPLSEMQGILANQIRHLFEDADNNVWIATHDNGLIELVSLFLESGVTDKMSNEELYQFIKVFNTQKGLNFNKVNHVLQDREHNIWIATEIGVNLYRGEKFLLFDEKDGLSHGLVWDVMEDDQSSVWIATENAITIYRGNEIEYISTLDGLPHNKVMNLCMSRDYIWISTSGGCAVYSLKERKIVSLPGITDVLTMPVYAIDYDNKNKVWIGTQEGLYEFDENSGEIKHYTKEQGLTSNKIRVVYCDSKGMVWIGAIGTDLTRFDGEHFKVFRTEHGTERKLIFCIEEDLSGNIWFGAYGSGVYKLSTDGDTVKLKNYSVDDGLSGATPFLILCDNTNNIWVGTSLGIDRINQQTNIITHYGKNEGFRGIETNQGAAYRDKKGNLWFGTIMGAVKYNPEKDVPNLKAPITLISQLQISKKPASFPEGGVFDYTQNNLLFQCVGISLTSPEKVLYQYKLEGLDLDWSPPTSSNQVEYTNLHYRNYKLLVRSCNNDGVWDNDPATYSFVIPPPFWRTWWFYTLASGSAIGLLFGLYRLRIRNFEKQQEYLQQQVDLRTEELKKEKEKLEEAKKDIETKNKSLWQTNLSVVSEKEKVESIKKLLEEKNKHVTDSIKYAKRIQRAILPQSSLIKKHIPAFFIIYEPKDIVSGDFYWFYAKDDRVFLAAVDCTGHGVPGAFMSLIGYTLLNQIVGEQEVSQPAKILDMLDKGVKKSLHQYMEGAEAMDGMDVSVLSLDVSAKRAVYSGALRPLFLSRDGEIEEIKGNRHSVGGHDMGGGKHFEEQELKLQKGDKLYMFSDGVTDQFGGPKDRKYTKKNWREFLASLYHAPFADHSKKVQQELNSWQGSHEQLDDIMIIGIQI